MLQDEIYPSIMKLVRCWSHDLRNLTIKSPNFVSRLSETFMRCITLIPRNPGQQLAFLKVNIFTLTLKPLERLPLCLEFVGWGLKTFFLIKRYKKVKICWSFIELNFISISKRNRYVRRIFYMVLKSDCLVSVPCFQTSRWSVISHNMSVAPSGSTERSVWVQLVKKFLFNTVISLFSS